MDDFIVNPQYVWLDELCVACDELIAHLVGRAGEHAVDEDVTQLTHMFQGGGVIQL